MTEGLTAEGIRRTHEALVSGARAGEEFAQKLRQFLVRISDPSADAVETARELGLEDWVRRIVGSDNATP